MKMIETIGAWDAEEEYDAEERETSSGTAIARRVTFENGRRVYITLQMACPLDDEAPELTEVANLLDDRFSDSV